MRSGSIGLTLIARVRRAAAVALLGALGSGCALNNEGNITTPPPLSVFPPSGGSSTGGSGSGTGGESVIPSGGTDSGTGDGADLSKPWKSSGCGMAPPTEQVPSIPGNRTGYTEYFV